MPSSGAAGRSLRAKAGDSDRSQDARVLGDRFDLFVTNLFDLFSRLFVFPVAEFSRESLLPFADPGVSGRRPVLPQAEPGAPPAVHRLHSGVVQPRGAGGAHAAPAAGGPTLRAVNAHTMTPPAVSPAGTPASERPRDARPDGRRSLWTRPFL